MITDIYNKSIISQLYKTKLPDHWEGYSLYKSNELSTLTQNAFLEVINEERVKVKPFINSQIVISNILTEFGNKHNFHRQFREFNSNLDSGQILGMQLYDILIQDKDIWTCTKSKEKDHLFPHVRYFKSI